MIDPKKINMNKLSKKFVGGDPGLFSSMEDAKTSNNIEKVL
jgi:hypothetical protein